MKILLLLLLSFGLQAMEHPNAIDESKQEDPEVEQNIKMMRRLLFYQRNQIRTKRQKKRFEAKVLEITKKDKN